MKVERTGRGFEIIEVMSYATDPVQVRLVQASSGVGSYQDSYECPGSSYLWVGPGDGGAIHLDRFDVVDLAMHLISWVHTGSLRLPDEENEDDDADLCELLRSIGRLVSHRLKK